MRMTAVLVGVLAIALAASPALAKKKPKAPAAPPCVKDKVLVALEMRMMQTELVVGALSCSMTPRYNEFVKAYQPDLMNAHRTLLRYFGRESKMEDYKSKTANEASQRSLKNLAEFCSYTSALYDKLLGTERVQLASFVMTEPVAARHGFAVCGAPAEMITASVAPTDGKPAPTAAIAVAPTPAVAGAPTTTDTKPVPKPRFKPAQRTKKGNLNDAYIPPAAAPAPTPAASGSP